MIGLKRGTVQLMKYHSEWKKSFQREAKKVKKVFGNDALDIQHVGSTAISGVPAKPIIDIAVITSSLIKAKRCTPALKRIGYNQKKKDSRSYRLFFTKGPEGRRTYYLHVGEIGSDYVEDMILFRDYLRKHKNIAEKYIALKKKLAEKYAMKRETYTKGKEKFIEEVVRKAKNLYRSGNNP